VKYDKKKYPSIQNQEISEISSTNLKTWALGNIISPANE